MNRHRFAIAVAEAECVAITLVFAAAVRVALGPNLSALGLATGVAALTLCFLLLFATLHTPGRRGKGLVPPIGMVTEMLCRLLGLKIPLSKGHRFEKISGQSNCHGDSLGPRTDA